ncbi:MAG: leucine--tRNA ligase [candidate division WWE3 bacterium]|nr:leucine--tRNA ligase [candidate division WWE3 bacterium]
MSDYRPTEIEPKWQKIWEDSHLYRAIDSDPRSKAYILFEFPYPSGDRLHVGHARSYSALDALARKKRMQGYNVLLPMGWDAFGLPAENYAIKTHTIPQKVVAENIEHARTQAKSWGLSVDWSREINTTDQNYYKWTQWIFVKMFERGLAYSADLPINWCPSCKIGLANEEVVDAKCERCGTVTERRNVTQWVLRITDYADRLIDDLETVDYLPKIKAQQINWIGRSTGTNVRFSTRHSGLDPESSNSVRSKSNLLDSGSGAGMTGFIEVFTTRVDTIYGVTAIVVAPEHPLINKLIESSGDLFLDSVGTGHAPSSTDDDIINEVRHYVESAKRKSELDRTDLSKEKTGVFTGLYVKHPLTGEKLPVWVGDYVIGSYGGGAVMVVPAHDARDYEFAVKYNLPIKTVIQNVGAGFIPPSDDPIEGRINATPTLVFSDYGVLVDSGSYTGLTSEAAMTQITADLATKGLGSSAKHYHLRDWIFSRQHYWGEPIPLIHCPKCGVVAVPVDQLPVKLPEIEHYEPSSTGESPLAAMTDWVNVPCPKCGEPAKRDTDTMPNWAGSNWYFVAYVLAQKINAPTLESGDIFSANKDLLKYWLPVDTYNGGMEHTTLHLLYSRFVYKFLFDLGVVPGVEPYAKRRSHGMILGPDGGKMSKSRGNVINPDDIVRNYGADTLRMYEMFIGPFTEAVAWNPAGVVGVNKFLHRIWKLIMTSKADDDSNTDFLLNNLVHKVSSDLDENSMKFNTAVSSFMSFINEVEKTGLNEEQKETLLRLLAPFAPHITEELWHQLGHSDSVHSQPWPKYLEGVKSGAAVTIVVQVAGKVRGMLTVSAAEAGNQELVTAKAFQMPKVLDYLSGVTPGVVFVPGKIINFVV